MIILMKKNQIKSMKDKYYNIKILNKIIYNIYFLLFYMYFLFIFKEKPKISNKNFFIKNLFL
jgi:hypothetical protein